MATLPGYDSAMPDDSKLTLDQIDAAISAVEGNNSMYSELTLTADVREDGSWAVFATPIGMDRSHTVFAGMHPMVACELFGLSIEDLALLCGVQLLNAAAPGKP